MIRQLMQQILNVYPHAKTESMKSHPVTKLLTEALPGIIRPIVSKLGPYETKGSAGIGNWARVPWVVVMDTLITESAMQGYYIIYLFKADDCSGVYLSLNQGVTKVMEGNENPQKILSERADNFRSQIGEPPFGFNYDPISLLTGTTIGLGRHYEISNICSKFYPTSMIPKDEDLVRDLETLVSVYKNLKAAI